MKIVTILVVSFLSLTALAQKKTPRTEPIKPTQIQPAQTTPIVVPAPTQAPAPTEKPVEAINPLIFKTLVIDRKDIPYDSKEPFVFEFKNNGKEPVLITNVQTSCGCTAAEKPTEAVLANKQSKIVVNYDTKRVGPFTKTITVSSNATTTPIVLTISGNVLAAPVVPTTNPTTPAINN